MGDHQPDEELVGRAALDLVQVLDICLGGHARHSRHGKARTHPGHRLTIGIAVGQAPPFQPGEHLTVLEHLGRHDLVGEVRDVGRSVRRLQSLGHDDRLVVMVEHVLEESDVDGCRLRVAVADEVAGKPGDDGQRNDDHAPGERPGPPGLAFIRRPLLGLALPQPSLTHGRLRHACTLSGLLTQSVAAVQQFRPTASESMTLPWTPGSSIPKRAQIDGARSAMSIGAGAGPGSLPLSLPTAISNQQSVGYVVAPASSGEGCHRNRSSARWTHDLRPDRAVAKPGRVDASDDGDRDARCLSHHQIGGARRSRRPRTPRSPRALVQARPWNHADR